MQMISLPLWPTLAAIGSILVFVFELFKLYDEKWSYAILGTTIVVALSVAAFFCMYSLCLMLGGI